jgi:hypothetical protein
MERRKTSKLRMRNESESESLNARFKNDEINPKQLLTGLSLLVGEPKKKKVNTSWDFRYYSFFFYTFE